MPVPSSPFTRYRASELALANLDPVDTWADESGNGHTLTADGASAPVFEANGFEGGPCVVWDGVAGKIMRSATFADEAQPFTQCVIGAMDQISGTQILVDSSATQQVAIFTNSGTWRMFAGTVVDSGDSVDTNRHLIIATFDGAGSDLFLDNVLIGQGNAGANAVNRVVAGGRGDDAASNRMFGRIAEFIEYSRELTTTELNDLFAYYEATYIPQILVPTADENAGTWTTAPLWSDVDDDSTVSATGDGVVITSDAVGNNTNTSNADLKLATGTDPTKSTEHILRVRWNSDSGDLQAHCELWEGIPGIGTKRAEIISAVSVGTSEVEAEHILTAVETDAITDYSNLYVRLWGRGTAGGPSRSLVVDLVELQVPGAGEAGGGSTVAATPGVLTLDPVTVTPQPGAVEVAATPGALTLDPVAVTPTPGSVSVTATPGSLILQPVTVTPTPGPVTVEATPGLLTLQPVAVTAGGAVTATPGLLTLAPVAVTPVPGGVEIAATPGLVTLAPVAATPVSGGVTVIAEVSLLTLEPVPIIFLIPVELQILVSNLRRRFETDDLVRRFGGDNLVDRFKNADLRRIP